MFMYNVYKLQIKTVSKERFWTLRKKRIPRIVFVIENIYSMNRLIDDSEKCMWRNGRVQYKNIGVHHNLT